MTRTELLSLEPDHPNLVAAILACAKVGSGRIELKIDKTELGLIARAMQVDTTVKTCERALRAYDLYELDLSYLEIDINLYAKVEIR